MKTAEIALNLKGANVNDVALKGDNVYTNLKGNTNFKSCISYLPILSTEIATLKAAIKVALDEGTKAETSAEHDAERNLRRTLRVIAAVISYEAKGDETKLLTSGFDLKTYTPPTPKSFNAKLGKLSGEIDLEVNSYGTAAYYWEMSADPIGTWAKADFTSTSKTTIKGLTPGTKLWFRVSIAKGKDKVVVSDPYTIMVV